MIIAIVVLSLVVVLEAWFIRNLTRFAVFLHELLKGHGVDYGTFMETHRAWISDAIPERRFG